jgi:Bacterial Ig domain
MKHAQFGLLVIIVWLFVACTQPDLLHIVNVGVRMQSPTFNTVVTGVPSGVIEAELVVLDSSGVELLFDTDGNVVAGGSRVKFSVARSSRNLKLPVGAGYQFKLTARDGNLIDLAYGQLLNVNVSADLVLDLTLRTLLGSAQLFAGTVVNGDVDNVLVVYPNGHSDLFVPPSDFSVSYVVTNATKLSESKLGVKVRPSGGTVTIIATITGLIAPVPGTIGSFDVTRSFVPGGSSNVGVDLSPPVVTITSPTPNSTIAADSAFTIRGIVSDDRGVSKVEVYDGSVLLGNASLTGSDWSMSWLPSAGLHYLIVIAYDSSGNATPASVTLTASTSVSTIIAGQVFTAITPAALGKCFVCTTSSFGEVSL